ncbi:unnamed protein product, partial [Closterium sp. Yama58-4]
STTIVWFKHDLRVNDHPALHALSAAAAELTESARLASATTSHAIPLFVLDPNLLSALPASQLPLLLSAITSLRSSLRSLDSDLIIARGDSSTAIAKLCKQIPSVRAVTSEEEVETCWKFPLEQVRSSLLAPGQEQGEAEEERRVSLETWRAVLHNCQDPLALEFTTFKQQRGQPCSPLPPPSVLPPLPAGIDSGALPSLEELFALAGKAMDKTSVQEPTPQIPQVDGEASALSLLSQYLQADLKGGRRGTGEAELAGGNPVTASKPLSETIAELEVVPRASFHALFAPALSLGLLSHRYVHAAARGHGGKGSTAQAAIDTVEAREARELEVVSRASFHALFAPALSLGLLSHRYVHAVARRSSGGGRGSTAAAAMDTVEAREVRVCVDWCCVAL